MLNGASLIFSTVRKKIVFHSVVGALFSIVFVSVPWGQFIGGFVDRSVYIDLFSSGNVVVEYLSFESWVTYVTYEWLWNAGVYWMVGQGLPIEGILTVMGWLITFTFSLFILRKAGFLYLFFLVNPLFVDLVMSQIRIGVALVFLMIPLFFKRQIILVVLCFLLAILTHTAAILFFAFYVLASISAEVRAPYFQKVKFLILIMISLFFSILMGPAREFVLSFLQDRRADYHDMSSSYLYMSYWFFLLFFLCYRNKFWRSDVFSSFYFITLAVACFNAFFSFYSTRFLAVGIPFLAYTVSALPRLSVSKILVFSSYTVYASFQWFYWFIFSGK